MSRHQKDPLRPLTADERTELTRLSRSQSAPAAEVDRARALLAIADGASYTAAAHLVGRGHNETISAWVSRFNREGLAAVRPHHGGGPRIRYGAHEQQRILAEWARSPERETGRHRHLVVEPAAEGPAPGAGRPAAGEPVHHRAHPARGRPELAEEPHLVRDRRGAAEAQVRRGARQRSGCACQKKLIEQAYTQAAQQGLSVWCEDEAGPFQAVPHPGVSWQPQAHPARHTARVYPWRHDQDPDPVSSRLRPGAPAIDRAMHECGAASVAARASHRDPGGVAGARGP